MGVDAEMFARTMEPVTDEQMADWNYRIFDALGSDVLFVRDADGNFPAHRALTVIDVYEQDGSDIVPIEGETFIEVSLWGRYYGPDYERGDLPSIAAVARWLEMNVPGASVWYGGDSSGICAAPFGPEEREEFWELWASSGRLKYRGYTSPYTFAHETDYGPQLCGFCQRTMHRCGWGKNFAVYTCFGCGREIVTRDGGVTWNVRRETGGQKARDIDDFGWKMSKCPTCGGMTLREEVDKS